MPFIPTSFQLLPSNIKIRHWLSAHHRPAAPCLAPPRPAQQVPLTPPLTAATCHQSDGNSVKASHTPHKNTHQPFIMFVFPAPTYPPFRTAAVCHQGGGNSVKAGHTLQKEAIAEFLGGFTLENITTQVRRVGV